MTFPRGHRRWALRRGVWAMPNVGLLNNAAEPSTLDFYDDCSGSGTVSGSVPTVYNPNGRTWVNPMQPMTRSGGAWVENATTLRACSPLINPAVADYAIAARMLWDTKAGVMSQTVLRGDGVAGVGTVPTKNGWVAVIGFQLQSMTIRRLANSVETNKVVGVLPAALDGVPFYVNFRVKGLTFRMELYAEDYAPMVLGLTYTAADATEAYSTQTFAGTGVRTATDFTAPAFKVTDVWGFRT